MFNAWSYHAFITDSTLELVAAEKQHRDHAIIEQVNADLKDSALAHMPWRIVCRQRGLITVAARIARRSRHITLHLPLNWPHRDAFTGLFTTTHAPPRAT